MALQRIPGASPMVPSAPVTTGPALSTRDSTSRPFVELGVMFGQALGGREPVMQALTNLQAIGQEHGCDAIIAVKLMQYPTTGGPAVVAYGTGVRFLPAPGMLPSTSAPVAQPMQAQAGSEETPASEAMSGPAEPAGVAQ